MQREIVETLTRWLARLYSHQRIQPSPGIVKVNLGSGLRVAPGWINIDGSLSALVARWPAVFLKMIYRLTSVKQWHSRSEYIEILKSNIFIFHNLKFGIPFSDESVDFFYTAHMLEHISKESAATLIQESFRALKKGGLIRIGVPDLEIAFSFYQHGDKEQALGMFFLPSSSGSLGRHEYLYDFDMLASLLNNVGFVRIVHSSYRQGSVPDIGTLDHSPEQSLYVEASKP